MPPKLTSSRQGALSTVSTVLICAMARGREIAFEPTSIVESLYRPFSKQWLYYNRRLNERVYQMPRIFPDGAAQNLVIAVSALGNIAGFTALVSNVPVEFCVAAMKGGTQSFPLYIYDEPEDEDQISGSKQSNLFGEVVGSAPAVASRRREAITTEGLAHFQSAYSDATISREDIFYHVYGVLHSPAYRERFADNLGKVGIPDERDQ